VSLGVFGGTFNPIHIAHLRIAEATRKYLQLERIFFVPAADPPHKTAELANAKQRIEMLQSALAHHSEFILLTLEFDRPGPSYTVDTLRELRGRHAGEALWFVMGSDSFREIDTWREAEAIFELANLAVVGRHEAGDPVVAKLLPPRFHPLFERTEQGLTHRSGHEIRRIPFRPMDISSSDIRRRVARGASIHSLVPEGAIEIIRKQGLYQQSQEDA